MNNATCHRASILQAPVHSSNTSIKHLMSKTAFVLLIVCFFFLVAVQGGGGGHRYGGHNLDTRSRHSRPHYQPPAPSHGHVSGSGYGSSDYKGGHVHGSYTTSKGVNINGGVSGGCASGGGCHVHGGEVGVGVTIPLN